MTLSSGVQLTSAQRQSAAVSMTVHVVPLCPLPKRSAGVGAEQVQVHIPLCEEVVQITPNQHVLWASHNPEYY